MTTARRVEDYAERAAAVMLDAKKAGIGEGVVFTAFVAAIAGVNPHLARITLAVIEAGIAREAFKTEAAA
jgi:hypothetical protein